MKNKYIDADTAVEILGISKNSLYSYVSRGLIRSVEKSRSERTKKYYYEDVEKLLNKKVLRSSPEKITTNSLRWGEPVIETRISLIDEKSIYVKGYDITELAEKYSFEEYVAFLWGVDDSDLSFNKPVSVSDFTQFLISSSDSDLSVKSYQKKTLINAGIAIINAMYKTVSMEEMTSSISESLRIKLDLKSEYRWLIDKILILVSESELNVSAFTARCAASSGADIYSCVMCALQVFKGRRHGGNIYRINSFFKDAGNIDNIEQKAKEYLYNGRKVPGFGHRIFNGKDPRAEMIFNELVKLDESFNPFIDKINKMSVNVLGGLFPTVDFALVSACKLLGLNEKFAFDIYLLGRLSGWIAHIMEQYEQGDVIRPRALFIR